MQGPTYNVSLKHLDAFAGRRLIVRSGNPAALAASLTADRLKQVVLVQLLNLSKDPQDLCSWGPGIPIEIVMNEPEREAGKLYRFTRLLQEHPVRVVIPIKAGFSKAVRIACALQFPVKLEGTQPSQENVDELCEVLDFFLHHQTVAQPVEYFSGLLAALLHDIPVTLWDLQEENPDLVRYVTDDGLEGLARQPNAVPEGMSLDLFSRDFAAAVLSEGKECASCEFYAHCGGYFKWPDQSFDCGGIRTVLGKLRDEAKELEGDLAAFGAVGAEQNT